MSRPNPAGGRKPVTIGLYTGTCHNIKLAPASFELMEAFRSAQIQSSESEPTSFSMTFQMVRKDDGHTYDILSDQIFQAFSRVCLTASIDGKASVLLDGLITSVKADPGDGNKPSTVVIQGSDLTAAMTLHEKSIPWPCMNDSAIVLALLAQYAIYGIIPITIPTYISAAQGPGEVTQQQRGTDLDYIQNRASQNGYIFKVVPGGSPGRNYAYFGPPLRAARAFVAPQCPVLNLAAFPMGNVQKISFTVNHQAPEMWGGMIVDTNDQTSALIPVASAPSALFPIYASRPSAYVNMPFVRFKLMEESNVGPIQAVALLQGRSNQASGQAVTAEGSLDVERYGAVLSAPGVVTLRGAGTTHDGKYVVSKVNSDVTPESIKQTFTLSREGTGSTVPHVPEEPK